MEMGGIFSKIWSYTPPTIRFGRVRLELCLKHSFLYLTNVKIHFHGVPLLVHADLQNT